MYNELLPKQISGPTIIYHDSQGALSLAKNKVMNDKKKHIDVKYHFKRENIGEHVLVLKYLSTEHILSDMFTKALETAKHQQFARQLKMNI